MEKLKDILYDLGDVLVSLLIIAVIFLIVSWKLNDAFPLQTTLFSPTAETTTVSQVASSPVTQSIDMATSESVSVNTPISQQPTDSTTETVAQSATTEPQTATQNVVKKRIAIPSGSSGNSIAKILEQNGLIESRREFLKVVEKLGVGSRLQAGKFEISSDMSYEEIAKILSGK